MYNLDDLRSFVEIAERGGVTAAASVQGLSPATVSHRLNKLEQHLGVTLFHRSSRTISLSTEGAAFLERVQDILSDLANAEMDIGSHGGALRGHLRVTMAPWILSRFILPNLYSLRNKHPDLTFEFLAVDRFVNLVEERQDCAIRVGQLLKGSLLSRKLADNRRVLCASPDYLAKKGTPNSTKELSEHHGVFLPWQQDWGLGEDLPHNRLIVSNSDTLTDGATHGLGIAMKSQLAISKELKEGSLVEILPGSMPDAEAPISSLRPPSLKDSRKVNAFINFAIECFKAPT